MGDEGAPAPMRTLYDVRGGERPATGQLPLAMPDARTVTTPEFAGMTFLEVAAKSALNPVKGMPFAWSINPYRGCSHACSYCLAGDTPILLVDGSQRRLRDVRVGDQVWGTRRRGRLRYFVPTTVRDHWSTVRRAYRVALADGTALIGSGAHRLLTDLGWRHIAPTQWPDRPLVRPGITVGDWLTGPLGVVTEGRPLEIATRVSRIDLLEGTHELFDMTTGTGDFVAGGIISHNCFARPTHRYLDLSPAEDFERTIVVKTNVVEVLRAELARPGWTRQTVALGTNTDPYQRCEGRYELMPGIIDALAHASTPMSILTKGTLIGRDRELLADAAARVEVAAALTIGTLDDQVWRRSEPGTPHPRARLDTVARLNAAGVPTGVMLAPIMPGINDDRTQLRMLIDAAVKARATDITPVVLHLRAGVRELFMAWLAANYPHLVDRYQSWYRTGTAPAQYRQRVGAYVRAQRDAAWRRHRGAPHARVHADRRTATDSAHRQDTRKDAEREAHGLAGRPRPTQSASARERQDRSRIAAAHAAQQLRLL